MLAQSPIASAPIAARYQSTDAAPPLAVATVTGVSITPSSATVPEGSTRQFSATVAGTNGPSQAVTWSGSYINASGLFTAPAAIASVQTITITAMSQQDNSYTATATITVPAAIPHVAAPVFTTTIHTRARKRGRR